jgi:hypothetical protein
MKISFLFILTLFQVSTFSQTVKSIDKLICRVNHTKFSDSITIYDTTSRITKPNKIIGYLSGDTLMKSVATFKNSSRIRVTYYSCEPDWSNKPLYVQEIDSISNGQLTEVYGYDFTTLKSNIIQPLNTQEFKEPYRLLKSSSYTTEIGFALVDRNAKKYHFKVKLIDAVPLTPGCGTIAWAIVQKFEVISTDFPNYGNRFVLIIETCPEFLETDFFQDDKIYEVDVATNSGVTFSYSYFNNYEKENLPIFWSRKTIKVD